MTHTGERLNVPLLAHEAEIGYPDRMPRPCASLAHTHRETLLCNSPNNSSAWRFLSL